MTDSFLEYVFCKQFGRGPWRCPYCDAGHFSVQPPKDGCKVKFHCFSCGVFGDEFDIFKDVRGVRNYQDRIDMRAEWYAEWQLLGEAPRWARSPRGGLQEQIMDGSSWEAMEAEHVAICQDPDCENWCCRKARGWSDEQLKADRERLWQEQAARVQQGRDRVEAMRRKIRGERDA
jgi:hypothetical protein